MPSVLFIYKNKNLAAQFVKHFKLNGYYVYEFYDEEIPYYQFSKFQKLENMLYRTIKKDTQHIHNINHRNFINLTNRKLRQLKKQNLKFDYCFVVRGDLIPEKVLRYARSVSDKMIDYQLDGLSVSKKILEYQNLFDQIYVFDEQDIVDYPGYNLKSITNCFFEEDNDEKIEWDIYYTGSGLKDRNDYITNLITYLGTENFNYNINLSYVKNIIFAKKINVIKEQIPYEKNILYTKKSRIILDFKRIEHDGLSLRFFESLNFEKKIITNNKSILKHDFYHPDNIYVTDFKNFDGLDDFMKTPYLKIDQEIIEKYNFKFWIKHILE